MNPLELPSAESRATLAELRRLARYDRINICVVGPSGTGKSLYAREVHLSSPRRNAPYVFVNLAGIAKGFAASDLLGHVRGAFTGAADRRVGGVQSANGGTLVLDEITKSSRAVQNLLLELFDGGPMRQLGADRQIDVDVRLIALTSIGLEDALRTGSLIPDLYERLKPFVVEIAPLIGRLDDIEAIAHNIVTEQWASFGYSKAPSIGPDFLKALRAHPFTGNHRELEGIVQRALVNADGADHLRASHLPRLERRTQRPTSSVRLGREDFLAAQSGTGARSFRKVADEAQHYGVSVSTIHRWRAEKASADDATDAVDEVQSLTRVARDAGDSAPDSDLNDENP